MRLFVGTLLALALAVALQSSDRTYAQPSEAWRIFTHTDEVNATAVVGDVVWAATEGGVIRWDTTSGDYRVFTIDDGLPANQSRAILYDATTTHVWVGTLGGLAQWNGSSWRRWTVLQGLFADRVDGLAMDSRGRIWATTSAAVSIWDSVTMRTFNSIFDAIPAYYQDVIQSPLTTTVWAIEAGSMVWTNIGPSNGVHRYDGANWTTYTTANLPQLPSDLIDAVVVTADGTRWFGTGRGVVRWRPDSTPTRIGVGELPQGRVRSLTLDTQGRVWMGIYGCEAVCAGGLGRIDANDQIRVFYAQTNQLPSPDVRSVTLGVSGVMWVGTAGGLSRINTDDTVNPPWRVPGLPSNQINTVVRAGGWTWVGTDKGLARLDALGQWTVYTKANAGLASDVIHAIVFDGRDVWVATGENTGAGPIGGVSRWRTFEEDWVHYPNPVLDHPQGNIQALSVESALTGTGYRIWAGSVGTENVAPRLYMLDTDNLWKPPWISGQTGTFGSIRALATRSNRVWLATDRGVFYMNHGGAPSLSTTLEPITFESTSGGLLSNDTMAVLDDGANIWVGTTAGMSMHVMGTGTWQQFYVGQPPNGLRNNFVNGLVSESQGIWVLTQSGASRFNRFPPYAHQENRYRSDSPNLNNFTSMATVRLCERYFGTTQGLLLVAYNECNTTGPTPTPFPTHTATYTPTPLFSPTPTSTWTATPTPTATQTATETPAPTATGTLILPPSLTPTMSLTPSPSPTQGEGSQTPTLPPGPSRTPTATFTVSPTPSMTPSTTPGPSPTATATRDPSQPVYDLFLPYILAGKKPPIPIM